MVGEGEGGREEQRRRENDTAHGMVMVVGVEGGVEIRRNKEGGGRERGRRKEEGGG